MKNEFGLSSEDMSFIINVIKQYNEVEKAVIYGSRAMGNFKNGSDVDIALMGANVNFDTVSKIHFKLEEESPMPYFFDVTDYNHLESEDLKRHIEKFGKEIYSI